MSSTERKEIWGMSYVEISIIVILLCVGCVFAGILGRQFLSSFTAELLAENNASPSQNARPDYKGMLEANGFEYLLTDGEGNPSYVSSCGALSTVRSNSVGFAATHNPDNDCASKDVGRIIGIMYPSEVFDYVITAMNSLSEFDQMVRGTEAGYDISVVLTEYEYTLLIVIKDPR